MDLKALYQSLDDAQRVVFCQMAGTSDAYIRIHLLARAPRRKIPRPELMERLLLACQHFEAATTFESLLAFFYQRSPNAPTPNNSQHAA